MTILCHHLNQATLKTDLYFKSFNKYFTSHKNEAIYKNHIPQS